MVNVSIGEGKYITARVGGYAITVYGCRDGWRVTATNCYARRAREPYTTPDEADARRIARKWTIELRGSFPVEVETNMEV